MDRVGFEPTTSAMPACLEEPVYQIATEKDVQIPPVPSFRYILASVD